MTDAPGDHFAKRYKLNAERLRSGDQVQVAQVVEDLTTRERDHGLQAGERRMLDRARQLLDGSAPPAP